MQIRGVTIKYECPNCQGQLKYWSEFLFNKERTINKQTGKLNKKVSRSKEIGLEQHGLKCTKCDFYYYANENGNDKIYEHLNKIFLNVD